MEDKFMYDAPQSTESKVSTQEIKFECKDCQVYYGDTHAIKDVSVAIEDKTVTAFIGPSGCGKSTFAKVLMGLETATEGQILLDNQSIEQVPIENRDTKTVSSVQMVFQNPFDTLNPSMTVGRQIIRALEIFGIGKNQEEREQRMLELLDLVKLPRELATRMPRQLSGGQRQRVAIARALLTNPRILILDDSTSAIDSATEDQIQRAMRRISQQRTTFLITHRLSQIRWADRILVLRRGELVAEGTHDELMTSSRDYRRIFAGARN